MKILRVSVNNIASLAGLHTIDFASGPLASANLFAISGPTGSGKSTVLDAICLALYNTTPRLPHGQSLSEISPGEKQTDPRSLLRHETTDGFAEVAFVGIDNQIRTARWSVRRAHNKIDGKLQAVSWVLFKGNIEPGANGTVDAGGKQAEVKIAIENAIGLSFKQFTRAVLLAQNEFASFLKADDADRAQILETLTGTEIFANISKSVFARQREEQDLLKTFQAQLQNVRPMSVAVRQTVEAKLQEMLTIDRNVRALKADCEAKLTWYETLNQKEVELKQAELQWHRTEQAFQNAAPLRQEIRLSQIVVNIGQPLRQAKMQCDRRTEQLQQQIVTLRQGFEKADKWATQSADSVDKSKQDLSLYRSAFDQIQTQIQQARELDTLAVNLKAQNENAQQEFELAKQKWSAIQMRITALHEQVLIDQSRLDEVLPLWESLSAFATLAEQAEYWLERLDAKRIADIRVEKATESHNRIEQQIRDLQQNLATQNGSEAELQRGSEVASRAFQEAADQVGDLDWEALADERQSSSLTLNWLQQLSAELKQQQRSQQEFLTLQQRFQKDQIELAEAEKEVLRLRENVLPEQELAFSSANAQLQIMLAAVGQAAANLRTTLIDGHHCPVCGSTEHPHRDAPPTQDSVAIDAVKQHVAELSQACQETKSRINHHDVHRKVLHDQIVDRKIAIEIAEHNHRNFQFANSEQACVRQILEMPDTQQITQIELRCRACETRVEQIAEQEKMMRAAVERREQAREVADQSLRQLHICQEQSRRFLNQLELLEQQRMQGLADSAERKIEAAAAQEKLQALWQANPENDAAFAEDADRFCETFRERCCQYQSLNLQIIALRQSLSESQQKIANDQSMLEDATNEKSQRQNKSEHASSVWSNHQQMRSGLLDGRGIGEVVAEWECRRKELEQTLEDSTAKKNAADQQRIACETALKTAQSQFDEEIANAKAADDALAAWKKNFGQEAGCEPDSDWWTKIFERDQMWIETQTKSLNDLELEVTRAQSTCQVYRSQIASHMKSKPPTETRETLQNSLHEAAKMLATMLPELDHLRAELLNDDRLRQDSGDLGERVAQQELKSKPWTKLNDVIGSKDGDKFRKIAQRQTLDILLQYANFQLQHLSPRYRLERLPESLNLAVIDQHMANQRRTIYSLSGGETFLVSLALALGLASLTSNRLRIESLFIDEGFGSLDPQTLQVAMEALVGLQSQGRKVGVISHVSEMTDAIPVQIKVVKQRNGASTIQVP